LADGSSGTTTVIVAVAGGFFTVLVAIVTGLLTFRSSARSTDAEREKNFEAQVDAEMVRLRARNAALEQAVDQLQTKILRARFLLVEAKIDPAKLDQA
jgi:cell division protein FtsB